MSSYASLLNIDLNLPERLIAFVGYSSSDEQLDFEGEAMKYIVANDTYNFLKHIFDRSEYVFATFSEEGMPISPYNPSFLIFFLCQRWSRSSKLAYLCSILREMIAKIRM
jgi:hypothetical protein